MRRAWRNAPRDQADAFHREYAEHADRHCIVSSEMFFGRDLSPLQDRFFRHIDEPVHFLVYLRRFDDFIEADYKQRAKNGRQTGGVASFVETRLRQVRNDPDFLNFASLFDRIGQAVPNAVVHPRLYLRSEMEGGNVIPDFLSVFGVPPAHVAVPASGSNKSLSRVASEALGLFRGQDVGFDTKRQRRLSRALQASGDTGLFGRGDVLTPEERREINDRLEERNTPMRRTYFPDRTRLFPELEDADLAEQPGRGELEELARFQHAVRSILKLIEKGY
jgi:hypothetical protein